MAYRSLRMSASHIVLYLKGVSWDRRPAVCPSFGLGFGLMMYFSIWMLYFLVMEPVSFSSLFVSAFFPLVGWSILNLIGDCSGGRICCVQRSCSAARWSRLEAEACVRPMAATGLESIFCSRRTSKLSSMVCGIGEPGIIYSTSAASSTVGRAGRSSWIRSITCISGISCTITYSCTEWNSTPFCVVYPTSRCS